MASKTDDLLLEVERLLQPVIFQLVMMFQLEMMMMMMMMLFLPGTLSSPLPRHVFGLFSQTWQQG